MSKTLNTALYAALALALTVSPLAACSKKKGGGIRSRVNDGIEKDDGKVKKKNDKLSAMRPEDANDAEYAVARTALNRPKIGDKLFVASFYNQIFGPSVGGFMVPLIRNNTGAFGGPCDQLGNIATNHCLGRSSFSQAPVLPNSMATREGFRIRTCDLTAQTDAAIVHAVAQIKNASTDSKPGTSEVAKAYELFFPGHEPTQEVGEALKAVVDEATSDGQPPLEGWRFLFLTLCLAPEWQLL